MTPAEYVTEIVVPTVQECRDNRESRRYAYLPCIVTFHIKDHLKKAGATRIPEKMRTACPSHFDVVRGVCNGTKHVETDATHPIPFVVGRDYYRPPAVAGVMEAGLSMIGDTKGARVIHHNNRKFELYGSVKECLPSSNASFPCTLADAI